MKITFFMAGEKDLTALRRLDPDRDWREFHRGERVWILQTYLRLARAGYPVELAASPPAEGIGVCRGPFGDDQTSVSSRPSGWCSPRRRS